MSILKRYFTHRPVPALLKDSKHADLVRSLSATQLILIGIGAIIGAGIFVITGTAAGAHAGPAITLSFVLGGIACGIVGLCYAELASMIPISGGAYTFTYAAFGELMAFLIMGMVCLTYGIGSASVASGWSGYMMSLLADYHITLPAALSPLTGAPIFDLPAFIIVWIVSAILYRGTQAAAWFNTLIVFIKMSVLLLFVAIGAFFVTPANWTPFIPPNTGVMGQFGLSGIISGTAVVFIAFTGFDAVANTAQEAKNPQRSVPIGILGSLSICVLLYIAIAGVLTGIVPYTQLNVPQPMALAVDAMRLPWFALFIKIGAIAGLTSVILVMLYSTIRTLYAAVNDGLLPQYFSGAHKIFHTPHKLTLALTLPVSFIAATCPLADLVRLANFGTLVTFATVCLSTIFLHYRIPGTHRSFHCPGMPWLPGIGVSLLLLLLWALPLRTFMHAGIWTAILLILYFGYSQFNSHVKR